MIHTKLFGRHLIKTCFKITLFNLLVVSLLGLLLRASRNFIFPFIVYGNLLHAHSHFAFCGWAAPVIYLSLYKSFVFEKERQDSIRQRRGEKFFILQFSLSVLLAYCMLFSFYFFGYNTLSILLSALSLINALWYGVYLYRQLNHPRANYPGNSAKIRAEICFARSALFFLALSALGPVALAFLQHQPGNHEAAATNALYFYLHFQYNGWFIFGVIALIFKKLATAGISYDQLSAKRFFLFLFWGTITGYALSVLWNEPRGIYYGIYYCMALLSAALQLVGLFFMYRVYRSVQNSCKCSFLRLPVKPFACIILIAFVAKSVLQLPAAFPGFMELAIMGRNPIIGYLHLVFIGILTLSMLLFFMEEKTAACNRYTKAGLWLFSAGFILTETLLFLYPLMHAFSFFARHFNGWIFYLTLLLPAGCSLLLAGNGRK